MDVPTKELPEWAVGDCTVKLPKLYARELIKLLEYEKAELLPGPDQVNRYEVFLSQVILNIHVALIEGEKGCTVER